MAARLRLGAALGLVIGATLGTGVAEAAKLTETAAGGTLPQASSIAPPRILGEFRQTFELKGKKVKDKQVLDVDLTLNATGGHDGALGDVRVFLIGPKGENIQLTGPGVGAPAGLVWSEIHFDEQSTLRACDPTLRQRSNCNYLQGGTTYTGDFHQAFRPTFGGGNPKGTWTVLWQDGTGDPQPPTTIGTSTLQVKTGRKFEKD